MRTSAPRLVCGAIVRIYQIMANNNSNSEKRKTSKRYTPKQGKLRGVPLKRKNDGASSQNKLRPNGRAASQRSSKDAQRRTPVKIIPLGGLNEIGKNFTVIECSNDMFIIDCGLAFPDSEMLGVDIVIPDFTYVEKNLEKLRGVVITHGHEDHIGGLPYFLKKFPSVPVYGTRLTIGLIEGKLREHELLGSVKLNTVTPRQTIRMGCMAVEFIRVNHSIPDSVGMAIHTPAGVLIHTGDFKVDYTPIEGGIIDLPRFAELGNKGVLALMSDSTNSERPGYTASERKVGDNLEMLFAKAEGDIVKKKLAEGETMQVEAGHIVAFDTKIQYELHTVKDVSEILMGGGGLFTAELTGPGTVILQTHSFVSLAMKVMTMKPKV